MIDKELPRNREEVKRGQETCEETGRKRGKIPGGETTDERNEEMSPIPQVEIEES